MIRLTTEDDATIWLASIQASPRPAFNERVAADVMFAARLRHRGFILVATLWALAGLTLLASYVNALVTSDRGRAEVTRQALQDELDARRHHGHALLLAVHLAHESSGA